MATKKLTHHLDSSRMAPPTKHFTQLAHTVTPTNHPFFSKQHNGSSPLLDFEATDAELIEHGLLKASEIPSRAKGHSKSHFDGISFLHAKRMTDGRISLTISASLVRQRDPGFMKLMSGLAMLVD
jgi:hypothetical protein